MKMNLKKIFFLVLLITIAAISNSKQNGINSAEKAQLTLIQNSKPTFTTQKINYYAPKSSSVYLVWKINNHPLASAVTWNNKTKLTDGLLYTPMNAVSDTFSLKLNVLPDGNFQYHFWITKNKQGQYQDFWDLQSSGQKTISDTLPINKTANYTNVKKNKSFHVLDYGWIILFILIVIYLMLLLVKNKWFNAINAPSRIQKVLFLGLSLAVFHALARSEIIAITPMNVIYNPWIILKIIKASLSDFLFVFGLTMLFVLALWLVKSVIIRKLSYGIFVFLAIFSTLVAFTNITTVLFLGKPFNYQWLYYSDFLGSDEAKTAFSENISLKTGINLIAMCLSMLILSSVLFSTYKLLATLKYVKFIAFSLIGLMFMVLFIKAVSIKNTWTEGQSENAITSMIYSVYAANTNSSFFSSKISDIQEPFDPAQSTKSETTFSSLEESNVKNVLFIILESAGALYFDGYGGTYHLSPNLNNYASQAIIFDQMYAHAPATNRSLVSILGSIYPNISFKSLTQEAPNLAHPTISSVLQNKGYRTSFFSSANLNFQNCREFLAYRGFDRVEDFATINCSEEFELDNSDYKEGNGIDDMCLADCLTSWLDDDSTQNFFSLIWTVQGHHPYFFANEEEDFGVSDFNFNRYLNALKHNDELIGVVMQGLEERGLDSTTLVVVVGDHGEAFGQHQQYGHGTAVYEENLRVPLYFINPTLFHGERKRDIAGMKDLATTTLSIIDVEIPKIWQGRNLLTTDSDETFFFAPWSDYLFGYRKDNMKYIFNESQNTVEVYDLSTDAKEKTNLYHPEMKDEIDRVRSRMAAWVQYQDKFISQTREKRGVE